MGCGDVCLLNDEEHRAIEGSSRPLLINLTVPFSEVLSDFSERRLYQDPVTFARSSRYQRMALVQVPRGIRFQTRWCRRPQLSHNASVNSRVHPKYKTRYRVGNWPAYERALVQRGDVTLWLSPAAIAAWTPGLSGRPGGPRKFSDHAIETALTLRLVFRLPLRQTEGFVRSVLTLMATGLDAPDHTTLSRRGQPLDVALDRVPTPGPVDLVVDSTGLSVFGEGEWAAAKHGGRGKRGWKSAGPRPSAVEEGGRIPSTGARGERGLSVQVDHRTGPASPNDRRAEDRSAPRVQRAESDDRARSARVLPHRSLRGRRYGRVPPSRAILQQRHPVGSRVFL